MHRPSSTDRSPQILHIFIFLQCLHVLYISIICILPNINHSSLVTYSAINYSIFPSVKKCLQKFLSVAFQSKDFMLL